MLHKERCFCAGAIILIKNGVTIFFKIAAYVSVLKILFKIVDK